MSEIMDDFDAGKKFAQKKVLELDIFGYVFNTVMWFCMH